MKRPVDRKKLVDTGGFFDKTVEDSFGLEFLIVFE